MKNLQNLTTVSKHSEGCHYSATCQAVPCILFTIKNNFMNTTGKIFTAIAAGAAAGAILGVLFAPDKGSETRRKINEKGKNIAEDLKDTIQKGKDKINELKSDISKTVKEKVEEFA